MDVLYVSGEKSPFLVGRDPSCDLVLDDAHVSRRHLRFTSIRSDVASVEILGTNGAFVGDERVNKGQKTWLRAGDGITVGRYLIVWSGCAESLERTFVRGMVKLPEPDLTPIEIEGPPQRKVPEKPSVMIAAGPALTMAIPILLGAGRSVAVLSSVFAAVWAAVNVLGRVSRQKTEEKRRRNTYIAYLEECEDNIRDRINGLIRSLNRRYPYIEGYFKNGGDAFILWNSRADNGVLSVRIGRGITDNPIMISIPKDRFAQVDDSLKEMPSVIRKRYEKIKNAPVIVTLTSGTLTGFVLSGGRDRRILASVILQLASEYSPEDISISLKLEHEMMRYYMWTAILPHCRRNEVTAQNVAASVLITDDDRTAYEHISDSAVILVRYGPEDIPAGMIQVLNDPALKDGIRYDKVPRKLCFSYASALSRLYGVRYEGGIPDRVPLGQLLAGDHTIAENYRNCDIATHFDAPIGIGPDGKKIILDLHEKAAGPHGLIAGTTGSGKSELLTTLILSFSARYPADKLAFFLIDYKGGGMSNLFSELPHVLGNISNLSASESRRSMISLKSENIKRQKLFAGAGVNNINDYTRLYDEGRVSVPLPHVLVIVDEFAELKKEEPDFMDRLISISQVGRSLGIHLILATQKPSGVVDDKIRSNTRFRIALRLVDSSDSMDMLHRPDAAAIRECGRAYLQVGNDEVFECFQSGYAMCPADDRDERPHIYRDLLLDEEIDTGYCEKTCYGVNPETWFDRIIKEIICADKELAIAKPAKLWLPMLPGIIEDDTAAAVFDNPYEQTYERLVADIRKMGHIWITGRSGSGKSEFMYTLLDRIADGACVYIIDHGGGVQKDLSIRNSCGGYISDDRPDEIIRMTGFICEELAKRRRNRDKGYTPCVLALDNYTEIIAAADPEVYDHLMRILAVGKGADVLVVATSVSLPPAAVAKFIDTGFFLGNGNTYAVADFLKSPAREIPSVPDIPGRGVGAFGGRILEFQAVRSSKYNGKAPPDSIVAVKYPHIPDRPELDDLLTDALTWHLQANDHTGISALPIGYELKTGKLFGIPLDIRCVLIGGKPYCGRHTLLFNISVTAAAYGIDCVNASSYEELISILKGPSARKIITTESITDILDGFYGETRSRDEEDELAAFFENPLSRLNRADGNRIIIGIVDNETAMRHSGRKIYDAMTKHMFAISFGGCLDENRIFDFSYLPFTTQQKSHKRGTATIQKYDEKTFYGDIICPELINVDNS
ncbi:MAG: FHA domain-containing protein [Lachnospiraceae bacterium]|nr:FHA domain-containing protein [Lachnospiraceae bacterium]